MVSESHFDEKTSLVTKVFWNFFVGLSLFWTQCQNYGMGLSDLIRLMCTAPAELCGINNRKGKIAVGYDAGMVSKLDTNFGFTNRS